MKLILEKVFAEDATELEGILIIKHSMFVTLQKRIFFIQKSISKIYQISRTIKY